MCSRLSMNNLYMAYVDFLHSDMYRNPKFEEMRIFLKENFGILMIDVNISTGTELRYLDSAQISQILEKSSASAAIIYSSEMEGTFVEFVLFKNEDDYLLFKLIYPYDNLTPGRVW